MVGIIKDCDMYVYVGVYISTYVCVAVYVINTLKSCWSSPYLKNIFLLDGAQHNHIVWFTFPSDWLCQAASTMALVIFTAGIHSFA